MYIYGGSTCPLPPVPCDFWGYPSLGPFLNDTVVLDFSPPGGPAWRVYSAAAMLERQRTPGALPPAMGVALSAYDPDAVALVVWSCLENMTATGARNLRGDLPVWSLDLVRAGWQRRRASPPLYSIIAPRFAAVSCAANVPVARYSRRARLSRPADDPIPPGDPCRRV